MVAPRRRTVGAWDDTAPRPAATSSLSTRCASLGPTTHIASTTSQATGAAEVEYKYGGTAENLEIELVDRNGAIQTGCSRGTPTWDILSSCSQDFSEPCVFKRGYVPIVPLDVLYQAAGVFPPGRQCGFVQCGHCRR